MLPGGTRTSSRCSGGRSRLCASALGSPSSPSSWASGSRTRIEVVEFVPDERLVMRTAEGPFAMGTTYMWAAAGSRATRMTLRNRGAPSGFSRLAAPLMAANVRKANRKDLERLKSLLEGSSGVRSSRGPGGATAGLDQGGLTSDGQLKDGDRRRRERRRPAPTRKVDSWRSTSWRTQAEAWATRPRLQQKAMDAWMAWFGSLGADIVDQGSPFGPSTTVSGGGTTDRRRVEAHRATRSSPRPDLPAAAEKAKGCPGRSRAGAASRCTKRSRWADDR